MSKTFGILKNKEKSPQEPRSNNKKDICNPVKIQHTKDSKSPCT